VGPTAGLEVLKNRNIYGGIEGFRCVLFEVAVRRNRKAVDNNWQ
jgi:hypothetical protein